MSEKIFNKVLAANRGEIAVRIFRACYDLGIHTVAMYSKEDELSLFRTRADEAYLVGENKSPLGAYLDIPEIIDLAKRRGVDAIHPGYGFLSENADFARACEEAGITFIGPPSDVLGKMGDKLSAKQIAMECGVPVIPGCSEPLRDGQEALEKAISFGFPVILKAAAGGGGRGMRLCEMPEDVIPAFELVKNEARKAFGNDDIFIEKYLVQPKHIEVQILADQYGNVRHLGERDCSLQRRYQKVVEFAPAWSVPESIREQLHADAVKIAEAVGYVNAGTGELLVDRDGKVTPYRIPRLKDVLEWGKDKVVFNFDNKYINTKGVSDEVRRGSADQPSGDRSGRPEQPQGQRLRHPVPRDHRGPGQQLRARQRQDRGLPLRRRLRRASRRRQRRHGLDHLAVLRLAARQGHELGLHLPRRLPQGHPRHQ